MKKTFNSMPKTGNFIKYSSRNPIQRFLISKFLMRLNSLFEKTKCKYVLDAGCGEGFVTDFLRRKNPNVTFVGVDNSKDAILVFKKKNPACEVFAADIKSLPFKNNEFDLVIATEVLEHLENPERALLEIQRVTKKFCLLSVPNEPFFRISNFLRGKNLRKLGSDPDHKNLWSKKSFVNLSGQYFAIEIAIKSFPWIIILGRKIENNKKYES